MFDIHEGRLRDRLLRTTGLIALACCWLLLNWLFRSAGIRQHEPTLIQTIAAAAGLICFSMGAGLASLGEHVFDQVEVSQRWAGQAHAAAEAPARLASIDIPEGAAIDPPGLSPSAPNKA